jgi:hypothetical protein
VQLPPDYTQQLAEIVQALNRPSTPTWLVAVIGSAVGATGAIAAQILRAWYDEHRANTRMRRRLYTDLADLFLKADFFRSLSHETEEWRQSQFKHHLHLNAIENIIRTPDVYLEQYERRSAEMLYISFKRIIEDPQDETVRTALSMFAEHVHDGFLKKELFKRFMEKKAEAATVLTRAEEIYSENHPNERKARHDS